MKEYNAANIDELLNQGLIVSKRRESAVIVLDFPSFQIYEVQGNSENEGIFYCGIAEPGLRLEKIVSPPYAPYTGYEKKFVSQNYSVVMPKKAVRFSFFTDLVPRNILTRDHPQFEELFDGEIPHNNFLIDPDIKEGEHTFEIRSRPRITESIELAVPAGRSIESPWEGKFIYFCLGSETIQISELNSQHLDLFSNIEQVLNAMSNELSKAKTMFQIK